MDILIRNIKMPKTCARCPCISVSHWLGDTICRCEAKDVGFKDDDIAYIAKKRAKWCPLERLPAHHGDLVDKTEVKQIVLRKLCVKSEKNLLPAEKAVYDAIDEAKVVVKQTDSKS